MEQQRITALDAQLKRMTTKSAKLFVGIMMAPKSKHTTPEYRAAKEQRRYLLGQIDKIEKVLVNTLVAEYMADPNCWPELWIADVAIPAHLKGVFIGQALAITSEQNPLLSGNWKA